MVLLSQLKTPPGQQMLSSQDWWKCNPSSHIHKIFIIHAKEFVLSPFCELCVLWYCNFFLVINLSLLPASYAKSVVEFNLCTVHCSSGIYKLILRKVKMFSYGTSVYLVCIFIVRKILSAKNLQNFTAAKICLLFAACHQQLH